MTSRPAAPSSRGLFRATGKSPKPVRLIEDGDIVEAEALPRDPHDFQPTPPEPTRAFLSAELARLTQFGTVWEPACGDGAMARELESCGLAVIASDLVDRGFGEQRDFFDFATAPARAIVTNPPYCEVNWRDGRGRFILHALETLGVDYMALLLSWDWPGAGGLAGLWRAHPPARVYLMRWRIDFTGQGAPPMLNSWFVWDRSHVGEPVLRMLDRDDDARQHDMFGSLVPRADAIEQPDGTLDETGPVQHIIAAPALDRFARADGFAGLLDLCAFWKAIHGIPESHVWQGVLIGWEPRS